ncbi:MAG: hypothetical protein ACXWC2_15375 [Ramlibacter sp.]
MVEDPDDVAPVEPLVPELLDVPLEPLVDGVVVVEVPEAPMPDDAPDVDAPLPMLLDEVGLEDEVDGVAVLLAEPPAAPMPDADPEADPVGPELQAARAPAQASAIINLFIGTPS